MNKCTQLLPFMQGLFDDPATARKAAKIGEGILKARSPRLSDIARAMGGQEEANYKAIQRFSGAERSPRGPAAIIPGGGLLCDRGPD